MCCCYLILWAGLGCNWCVYIPHHKYLIKLHSSPWFSDVCAAAIVHIKHFFCLYQQSQSFNFKVKFRQVSNHCKRVLEAAEFVYSNKTKKVIFSQELGYYNFRWFANSVLNRDKCAICPPFNIPEVLYSASDKAKLLLNNFCQNYNLDDTGSPYLIFLLGLIQNWICNIYITPSLVNKIITNFDLLKVFGPDCVLVVILKKFEPQTSYILGELLKICLQESCFPDCWRVSSVISVFKNVQDKSMDKSNSPISLLSVINKIF